MLRTRLWMGAVLIGLAVGVLLVDQRLAPWYPFLFVLSAGLAGLGCVELLRLLPEGRRPAGWLCGGTVLAMVAANWLARWNPDGDDPWHWVVGVFTAGVLLAFLVEMATFEEPGGSVVRIAVLVWAAAYLGLLTSFLVQLRWTGARSGRVTGADVGTVALALAIFVPKVCDIGAYFTGRLLGRHRMTPVLSPKKTWEGAAGGLVAASVAAVGIDRLGPVLPGGWTGEVGFGLTVGLAGMLGDLAESLIKRDCQQKDASQAVPGFGGILDVVDSVVFAAPVAYCWLR